MKDMAKGKSKADKGQEGNTTFSGPPRLKQAISQASATFEALSARLNIDSPQNTLSKATP